jgi:hypothetical protein
MKEADASPETAARRATRERLEAESNTAAGDNADEQPAAPNVEENVDDEFSIEEDLS